MAKTPPGPTIAPDPFARRLAAALPGLSPAARRVARFIAENRALALALSAAELAARTATSDATVIRTIQALGYAGLPQLRRELVDALAGRQPDPAGALRATLAEAGTEIEHALDLALAMQREGIDALASPESRAALRAAVTTLRSARRIVVFGLGPSAALARHLAFLLRRVGRASAVLEAAGITLADQMLDLAPGDALVVLAHGRPYREVTTVFAEAGRLSLPIVLVSEGLDPALARRADVVVPARRGRTGHVALHGAVLVALEAIALGLAASDAPGALAALERLRELRHAIAGGGRDAP